MTMLIVGIILFSGMHLVPSFPRLRQRWVAALGERRYQGVFAVLHPYLFGVAVWP